MAELLTPPIQTFDGLTMTFQSPCPSDGGFSYERSLLEEYPENLRQLAEAPSDEATGVPLVLYPHSIRNADKHHPEHPQLHPMLADVVGLALRGSRVLVTDYNLHHNLEHNTFRGPRLPRTEQAKIERIIFNAAGMIPEFAVDIQEPGKYSLKRLPENIRMKLWRSNMVRVERPYRVREAIKSYLFDSAAELSSKKDVHKLLSAKEPADLWEAAKRILSFTALIKTESIGPQFRQLYEAGLLEPRDEAEAWRLNRFVVSLAVGNRHSLRTAVARELQEQLTTQEDSVTAAEPNAA